MLAALTRPRPRRPPVRPLPLVAPDDLPGLLWWAPATGAKTGGAVRFTAASSQKYAAVDSGSLSIGDVAMDLVGWVKLETLPASGAQMGIAGKWQSADQEYLLAVDNTGGTVRFVFSVRDTGNTTTTTVTAAGFGTPVVGTWYFLHAFHDPAADLIGIRVNNGSANTAATSGGVRDGTAAFTLGSHTGGSYLDATLQRWGLAKGTLLTAGDLAALYNGGAPVRWSGLSPSLQAKFAAWWDLAPITAGDRLEDQALRANLSPGTVVNAAWDPGDLPAPLAGQVAGSMHFAAATPSQRVSLPGIVFRGPDTLGYPERPLGFLGPSWMLSAWGKLDTTGNVHNAIQCVSSNGLGMCVETSTGPKLAWYPAGAYRRGATTLARDTWYHLGIISRAHYELEFYVNGVPDGHETFVIGGHTQDLIGGTASGSTLTWCGNLCDVRTYLLAGSAADMAALAAGGEASFAPVRRYRLDEGTGTVANDAAAQPNVLIPTNNPTPAYGAAVEAIAVGDPVRELLDVSAGGNTLTAGPTAMGRYGGERDTPLARGMAQAVRFQRPNAGGMSRAGVTGLGNNVTGCTLVLVGRMWDAARNLSGKISLLAAGLANNASYTAATSKLGLGYYAGTFGTTEEPWYWYAECKGTSGSLVTLKASYPHAVPVMLAVRYAGGSSLALYLNGAKVGETTTGIPASLDLSALFELGKSGAAANLPGWEHYDGALYSRALSDAEIGDLHRSWAAEVSLPSLFTTIVADFGPFTGSNPDGWALGSSMVKSSISGDLILFFITGYTDPAYWRVRMTRSTDNGATWGPAPVVLSQPEVPGGLCTAVNEGLVQLANGTLLLTYREQTYPPTAGNPSPATSYVITSANDGVTWSSPVAVPAPAGWQSDMFTYGRPVERTPGGEVWLTAYGLPGAQVSPNWEHLAVKSSPPFTTWTLATDFGSPGIFPGGNENAVLPLGSGRWLGAYRTGTSLRLVTSDDDGVTWRPTSGGLYFDANGASPVVHATPALSPNLYRIQSGPAAGEVLLVQGQRGSNYAGCRSGIRINRSKDGGQTWGPSQHFGPDQKGWGYATVVDLGDGWLGMAFTEERAKIRFVRFHESVIP